MTTLAITPNWKNKTAKFKGTVAAGEHVSVTIQNENGDGGEFIEDVSTLRLRVVDPCNGRTLAIFPEPVHEGETPEEWDSDLSPLRCTLNLNTVQMLKSVPPAANVPLLWVLDDYDNNTLYFKEQFEVTHWPRLRGEEEPTDLDNYKDIIEDFNTRLTAAEQTVATAATNAQSAANSASAAADSAATAATAATDAQTGAITSKNAAQTAANDAASAKTAAEDAQDAAEAAQEAAETAQGKAQEYAEAAAESAAAFVVDDTLSVEGAAADAKAVGDANQDLITQIETVQDNLDAETTARETLGSAVQVDRQNLASEIARAQSAEQSLENRKADKATTYTKTEVDTKIAGVQTFEKYLVQTLPDPDEADMKGLYLVPTGETSDEGDLCEEWTVVEENGEKRWERIGAKAVDLTLDNTVTPTSANGVKSSGIWSALWGALSALPTGFSSLYDWCVAQIAKLRDKLDLAVYERGCAVSFPAGYSVTYGSDTYTAPSGGETIELFGPISSTAVPQYNFWVPYEYKDATDFDPQAQTVWCLFGSTGNSVPAALMYGTGASYNIANWDTEAPTLALSNGEATGGEPTMTRPLGATGDTLAKASQLDGKLDKSGEGWYVGYTGDGLRIVDTAGVCYIDISPDGVRTNYPSVPHVVYWPKNRGTTARLEDIAGSFSSSTAYAKDALVERFSMLYRCVNPNGHTGVWVDADFTPATVEDILAALRTGKADVSAIPYDRITITTGQLQDHAEQKVTLNAATTTLALPALTDLTGKVSDFGIDMVNGYAPDGTPTAASFQLDGTLGTDYNLIVPDGEDWSEMSTLAAGEMAVYYFTLSAFQIGDLPTWGVLKQVVTLVPVPVAP